MMIDRARQLAMGFGLGVVLVAGVAGCHSNSVNAQSGPDPAAANMAPENEAQQQAAQYGSQPDNGGQQPPAPIERAYPAAGENSAQAGYAGGGEGDYEPAYDESDLTDWQATEPPPPLPEYDQPPDPDPDYIWTPGYWAWGPYGYYWVPGCWVAAPYVDALWTPGYWIFVDNVYRFHHGYWGRHIGFYGGINYGFGYFGVGYEGGYWNGSHFYYNTRVTRVNSNVRNVYVHDVTVNRGGGRVSFNGGRGGIQARPRPAEVAAMRGQRIGPMQSQVQVRDQASHNRQQFYSSNHGRPAAAVETRPVARDRSLPAELPRAAAPTRSAGRPAEVARPGQTQGPVQRGRPENVPRGGNAPEVARPGQQGRPGFQPRPQEARPMQPQNEVRPQQQQPDGNPQGGRQRGLNQGQPQTQAVPQQQARPQVQAQPQATPNVQRGQERGQGRPDFQRQQSAPPQQARPQEQMRQQGPPPQQARPQEQMRQQGPPQRQAPPQQAQPQRQAPSPQAQHTPPQQPHQQAAPPAAHGGGDHGQGHGGDRHN
jgi:hypothetical protein